MRVDMTFVEFNIGVGAFPVSVLETLPDRSNHRRCVTPDDDLSDLPQDAQDKIRSHWDDLGGAPAWEATANPPPEPVTPADIKAEALRRMAAVMAAAGYEDRGDMALAFIIAQKQNDASTQTAVAALWQQLKAIRAAGIALAKQKPIPVDFAADANWPAVE